MSINNKPEFITDENICGAAYRKLLYLAMDYCDSFQLICRDSSANKDAIDEQLAPFLMMKKWEMTTEESNSYHFLEVSQYELNEASICTLASVSNSLFDWDRFGFLENLTFIDRTGNYWLESVANEHLNIWHVSDDVSTILLHEFEQGIDA